MSNEEDNHPHPHPHQDQGKRKKMRTSSSSSSSSSSTINHHLFDLLPNLFDLLSEQVINLFNLLPEEVIIDQILSKLPEESLLPEQEQVINPFDLLPEEVIIDQILLKLPVESLLSLRCVSKCLRSLITSPSFVQLHTQLAEDHHSDLILFSTRAPKQVIRDVVFPYAGSRHSGRVKVYGCANDYLIRNYVCKFSAADRRDTSRPEVVEEMNCPFPSTDIRASCNGLLYVHGRPICIIKSLPHCCFSQGGSTRISPSYIWNPCTKEYKELPPPPPSTLLLLKEDQQPVVHFDDSWNDSASRSSYPNCNSAGFCGFGYDQANNEYKILYYEQLSSKLFPTTEFKVYTLGTNTWTSISDNPYKSLIFGQQWLRIGLFVSGALHWIMSEVSSSCAKVAKIISFDIEKEVFTEILKPPLLRKHAYYGNLQMLKGCLCVCQFPKENWREAVDLWKEEVDLWMLKDYAAKDSWTKFLRVLIRPGNLFNYFDGKLSIRDFKLLRYCENGEIAMLTNSNDLVLYYPYYPIVTPVESKFNEDVKGRWQYQMNFRKSLVSLNSGTYTR